MNFNNSDLRKLMLLLCVSREIEIARNIIDREVLAVWIPLANKDVIPSDILENLVKAREILDSTLNRVNELIEYYRQTLGIDV